jgi:hypothetical protein
MNIPIQSCAFVSIPDVLSPHLTTQGERDQFWALISENAPFSWGDNNRSMVTASSLADHCQDRLDGEGVDDLLQSMRDLGEIYVDLES